MTFPSASNFAVHTLQSRLYDARPRWPHKTTYERAGHGCIKRNNMSVSTANESTVICDGPPRASMSLSIANVLVPNNFAHRAFV